MDNKEEKKSSSMWLIISGMLLISVSQVMYSHYKEENEQSLSPEQVQEVLDKEQQRFLD